MTTTDSSRNRGVISRPVPRDALAVLASYRQSFPVGNATWYLTGSHADGSAIDISDIDLFCLADPLPTSLYTWARSIQEPYGSRIDISLLHPSSLNNVLSANAIPMIRSGRLILGPDVRDTLPALNLRAYQETVGWKFGSNVSHFHPTGAVQGPPDPRDEFLGFVGPAKQWTGLETWTHDVVVLVGSAATAMAAARGQVAGTRREGLLRLRNVRGFEKWADVCTEAVGLLRDQWRYRVPHEARERHRLRSVCERLCDLENATLDELDAIGVDPYRDNRLSRLPR